jgi:hypothetical protein
VATVVVIAAGNAVTGARAVDRVVVMVARVAADTVADSSNRAPRPVLRCKRPRRVPKAPQRARSPRQWPNRCSRLGRVNLAKRRLPLLKRRARTRSNTPC